MYEVLAMKINKVKRIENYNFQHTASYSFVFNTSHVVLGVMPNFFPKHVWITRHVIPITQRPGWNTRHNNPL